MANHRIFHIEIDEESDYVTQFFFKDPTTNLPVPLQGYRADMQVRKGNNGDYAGYDDIQTQLNYTTDNGGIVLNPTSGSITLTIPALDTQNLKWNRAVYDMYLIDPTGKRTKFVTGFISVIPSSTHLASSTLSNSGSSTGGNSGGNPGSGNSGGSTGAAVTQADIQILQAQIDMWGALTLVAFNE